MPKRRPAPMSGAFWYTDALLPSIRPSLQGNCFSIFPMLRKICARLPAAAAFVFPSQTTSQTGRCSAEESRAAVRLAQGHPPACHGRSDAYREPGGGNDCHRRQRRSFPPTAKSRVNRPCMFRKSAVSSQSCTTDSEKQR